jgi:hypothetical protein
MALLSMPVALWLLQNIHDAKFRVVDDSILQQRVLVVFFSLIERFPSLSVTYTMLHVSSTVIYSFPDITTSTALYDSFYHRINISDYF